MPPEAASGGEVEREPTELDDFLASSEHLYHREVTRLQIAQHQERVRRRLELDQWANAELAEGVNGASLDFSVAQEMRKLRLRQREELAALVESETLKKADRDFAIFTRYGHA